MKSIFFVVFSVFMMVLAYSSFAAMYTGTNTVHSVLDQIMKVQGVTKLSNINPSLIDKTLLVDLGNGILDRHSPISFTDREVRLWIDGENPEGAAAIGYDYLVTQARMQKGPAIKSAMISSNTYGPDENNTTSTLPDIIGR